LLRKTENFLKQLFFVREVPVDWTSAASGFVGDGTEGGSAVTALRKESQCRVNDRLPSLSGGFFCSTHAGSLDIAPV
jgi:hypothetical protein